jgi:hypothetical protein
MLAGLNTLIKISYVDDTEIFKSCLDYWQLFVADIFGSCTTHALPGERGLCTTVLTQCCCRWLSWAGLGSVLIFEGVGS